MAWPWALGAVVNTAWLQRAITCSRCGGCVRGRTTVLEVVAYFIFHTDSTSKQFLDNYILVSNRCWAAYTKATRPASA